MGFSFFSKHNASIRIIRSKRLFLRGWGGEYGDRYLGKGQMFEIIMLHYFKTTFIYSASIYLLIYITSMVTKKDMQGHYSETDGRYRNALLAMQIVVRRLGG